MTKTVTEPPPAVRSTAGTIPPVRSAGFALGHRYVVPGSGVTAAVLHYKRPSAGQPEHGKANVAIEVRVCAVSQAGEVGDAPWSLVGADGSSNAVYLNGGGLEEPQYLDGNSLSEGECARGWISFEIPKAERIVAAKYVPHSAEGDPLGGARWALG